MVDQPFTHKSEPTSIANQDGILEKTDKNGIKCIWSRNVINPIDLLAMPHEVRFSWKFDWNELKKTGVNGLSGHITVTSPGGYFNPQTIDVDLTENSQVIETKVNHLSVVFNHLFIFEYQLIPHRVSYDNLFLPSELNDTILVIDEKRLHVNRAFLSIHSDFFRTLFSSKFKEGQMDEIPIKDVSYTDFGLLMSTIYPNTVFPTDRTAETLLELADRFLMPSVTRQVEFHLLHDTRLSLEKLIWMADKYGMPKLLKKCISELDTIEKAKKLYTSPEDRKLSKEAKAAILDRLVETV